MRKFWYLVIAVSGNAIGTALMDRTNLGMTAWGSAARNTSNFFNVSLGMGFVILSITFYIIANIIRKRIDLIELIQSFIFMFAFAFLSDAIISVLPDLSTLDMIIKLPINVVGMLILLFSIAVHLRVNLAVHPMDVYLHVIQDKLTISKGTYLAYFSGFAIAIIFGLLHGFIDGISIGTAITLLSSGLVMKFYNEKILNKWDFS